MPDKLRHILSRSDWALMVQASVFGELVLLRADGEDFNTVMAGIQSSKCAACDVAVVLERAP